MDGTEAVMEPACFRAIDEVGDNVEGVGVIEFRVHNIGDCFVIKVDLSHQSHQINAQKRSAPVRTNVRYHRQS